MRDPARIPLILFRLLRVWEANPDLRLGQLIGAAATAAAKRIADKVDATADAVGAGALTSEQRRAATLNKIFSVEDEALLAELEALSEIVPPAPMARSMQKRLAVQRLAIVRTPHPEGACPQGGEHVVQSRVFGEYRWCDKCGERFDGRKPYPKCATCGPFSDGHCTVCGSGHK